MNNNTFKSELDEDDIDRIIREHDKESNFRKLTGIAALIVTILGVSLSLFHVYTAGYGLLNEVMHRTIHLTFVIGMVFLVFPRSAPDNLRKEWIISLCFAAFYIYIAYDLYRALPQEGLSIGFVVAIGGLILLSLPFKWGRKENHIVLGDWILAITGAGFSLYLVVFFQDVFIDRVGEPGQMEYFFGVIAIIMILEATRRAMGAVLPIIGIICVLYALFGPYLPGTLGHRGYNILRIVNHLYVGTEGFYGIAVGVVATYVFHFVLFGILAQASGLGQLFINLAAIVAGKYTGGSAKVSVVSSGFFGMISGSPIANTVTTGAFTIPMMKRSGFSPRFSAAVEASASCGGQVTPPIMGASAFVMTELLGIPYNELILIAIIPAAFHYFAILLMVHLEAKRLNLEGLSRSQIPLFKKVIVESWHLMIPLIVMVTLLLMQYTPFLAAFWGILLTIVTSYIPLAMKYFGKKDADLSQVLYPKKLVSSFENGAKAALAIGAACACVGFILGITTLSGLGFKFSGAVVQLATDTANALIPLDIFNIFSVADLSLFFGLVFVAIACIIMGAGIPTTPTYIILASIAAPALNDFGIPLLATHFFVFYFGVLADVTPPVALAAYAGAGIAGAPPMQTGFTAFRLSLGKALVPFMFVYAPSLLFVDFTWIQFLVALVSGIVCVTALSAASIGYFGVSLNKLEKLLLVVGGLLLISPNAIPIIIGGVLVIGVLVRCKTRSQE